MSNFTFFHNVSYAICILKFFNGHISVVFCSLFQLWTVSKWCFREWVKPPFARAWPNDVNILLMSYSMSSLLYKRQMTDLSILHDPDCILLIMFQRNFRFSLFFIYAMLTINNCLILWQTTNFGLFHTERLCRRQFQI